MIQENGGKNLESHSYNLKAKIVIICLFLYQMPKAFPAHKLLFFLRIEALNIEKEIQISQKTTEDILFIYGSTKNKCERQVKKTYKAC